MTVHCNNSRSKFVKQRFYKSAVKALELFRIYQHEFLANGVLTLREINQHKKTLNGIVRISEI